MPTLEDQDQDLDRGTPNEDSGWNTDVGGYDWDAGENDLLQKAGGGYDENDPTSKAKNPDDKSGLDGDGLKGAEGAAGASPVGGGGAAGLPGEKDSLDGGAPIKADKAMAAAPSGGPQGRLDRFKIVANRRRGRIISGTIVTAIMVGLGFFAASTEIVHMRQELLDNSNTGRVTQNVLKKRRVPLLTKLVTKSGGYASRKDIKAIKLEAKLAKAGLKAEKNAAGAVTGITKNGTDINTLAARGGDDALQIADDINDVARVTDDVYKGPATRSLISKRFKGLISWLRGTREAGDSAAKTVAKDLDNADEVAAAQREAAESLDDVGNGLSDEEKKAGTKVEDATGGLADDAASKADDAVVAAAESGSDDLEEALAEAATKYGGDIPIAAVVDDIAPALAKKAPTLFGRLAAGAARSISVTEPIRIGCTARGTINFFSSIRNVLIAGLVAEGFVRFLTAADEAKAGVIQSSAMNVFMTALHSNGGYAASGAFQSVTGDSSASPSTKESSLYSGARAATGFLAILAGIVNSVPGLNPTTCRFAHNGLVIVGSAVVGAVIGFFTAGGSVAATSSVSIGLTIVQIALETIGVPLYASFLKGQVTAAFRENSNWGGTLAAGASSFQGSVGGSNALGMTTREKFAQLENEERVAAKYAMSKESIYNRYFNLASSDSFANKLAFKIPNKPQDFQNNMTQMTAMVSQGIASGGLSLLSGAFRGSASAAEIGQCYDDPQLARHDIAVDALCYPIVVNAPEIDPTYAEEVLLDRGEIDGQGTIVSEDFKDLVKNCYTGRPGLLYTEEVDKDGKNDPTDNTCVEAGPSIAAEPGSGNVFYGLNQIRQAYYAATVDMDAMTENINDDFGDDSATQTNQANNKVFVIGDSLTVGMNSLAPATNNLTSRLTTAGWSPTVNAQGCRGVYQPNGPITGDGRNCPSPSSAGGPIVDGLTVVNNPSNEAALKAANTYVVALGTNGTESTVAEFKAKATELLVKLKSINSAATIYWLNVRLSTNGNKATNYNTAINELATEQGIRIMDWDDYVTTVNSDTVPTNNVTWAPNDVTHHDSNGYTKKIDFILTGLGPAPVSSGGDVDCTAAVGNEKIICAAEQFTGIRYGFTTSQKILDAYGVRSPPTPGMRGGANAANWIRNRVVGGPNDFIDCSGYANVAMYTAFGYQTTAGCSGYYVRDQNNDGYADADRNLKIIPMSEIQPGDFLTVSQVCHSEAAAGHIGIYVGPSGAGKIRTLESSAGRNAEGKILSGYYERSSTYFKYAARYVGPGSGQ